MLYSAKCASHKCRFNAETTVDARLSSCQTEQRPGTNPHSILQIASPKGRSIINPKTAKSVRFIGSRSETGEAFGVLEGPSCKVSLECIF